MLCKFVNTSNKYAKLSYFDQMLKNKTAVHICLWQVSAQAHIQNMQTAATSVQIHWHMLNLVMDLCNITLLDKVSQTLELHKMTGVC